MMNVGLIVAAGRGHRLGGPIPKQYRALAGIAILRHTLLRYLAHPEIAAVQVLIHPSDQTLYDAATVGLSLRPALFGGATRQESVRLGLEGIADLAPDNVLIHDAVRPFVTAQTISAVLAALARSPAAIAGVPLADTLKRCADGRVTGTIDRQNLYRAQTPQGFRYGDILQAHRQAASGQAGVELTDDSMVAEYAGLAVEMVPGSEDNFKITTEHDLLRAEALLAQGKLD
jgi:2-C-methyl-D-erythritol 4-phosphate cytidylyltransferase